MTRLSIAQGYALLSAFTCSRRRVIIVLVKIRSKIPNNKKVKPITIKPVSPNAIKSIKEIFQKMLTLYPMLKCDIHYSLLDVLDIV